MENYDRISGEYKELKEMFEKEEGEMAKKSLEGQKEVPETTVKMVPWLIGGGFGASMFSRDSKAK